MKCENDEAVVMLEKIKTIFPDIEDKINEFPIALWEDDKYIHIDIAK